MGALGIIIVYCWPGLSESSIHNYGLKSLSTVFILAKKDLNWGGQKGSSQMNAIVNYCS